MRRITDPKFKYNNAASTDVGKTIRKEMKRLAAEAAAKEAAGTNVHPLADAIGKTRK